MRPRAVLLVLIAVAALAAFGYALRQLSLISVALAANADSQAALRRSIADQRHLAAVDPAHAAEYRRRFDETRTLLTRLQIIALARRRMSRRIELTLIGLVAAILAGSLAAYLLELRRRAARLHLLRDALEALSRGDAAIVVNDRGNDVVGTIARMIEETSRVIVRERRRVQALEHLSAWQEAARRHAHEMRTPLTAAQLELSSLAHTIVEKAPTLEAEVRAAEVSVLRELEQLRRFTARFVAFASAGAPQRERVDVVDVAGEFCRMFAPNWPSLALHCEAAPAGFCASVDREMLRQVLVNLCNNSALAIGDRGGNVLLSITGNAGVVAIDVTDDGPGVPEAIRRRIFEPYTTTRRVGEGMGLGLAISRKILLDHGGDLELVAGGSGATFRMTLPRLPCDHD